MHVCTRVCAVQTRARWLCGGGKHVGSLLLMCTNRRANTDEPRIHGGGGGLLSLSRPLFSFHSIILLLGYARTHDDDSVTRRRRQSLCLRGPSAAAARVVGRARAVPTGIEAARACSCAGGGGTRPIGWLLLCVAAGRGPMASRPRGGNSAV